MAKRTSIGLDIGCSGVRAAELSFTKSGVTLERFGQIGLPDGAVSDGEVTNPDAVRDAITELWSSIKFSHKKVYLGVANQRLTVKEVDIPPLGPKELKNALKFHVEQHVPFSLENALLDFHPVEEVYVDGDRLTRGMLVAAPRETIMGAVLCVQRAGLEPLGVDLSSFAILRSIGRLFDPVIDVEAIVDIGARVTNVIIHSAGKPLFVRIILMGGDDITDAIGERMGLPQDQAEGLKQRIGLLPGRGEDATTAQIIQAEAIRLVEEIRGSLDYYKSSHPDAPVDCLTASGGASLLPGLLDQVAAATRVSVRTADPLAALNIGNTGLDDGQLRFVQPLCALPIGLALGAGA